MIKLKRVFLIPFVLISGCSSKTVDYQSEIVLNSTIYEEKTESITQENVTSTQALSESFPKDIFVNKCVILEGHKCLLTYSRNNIAMIGIYDIYGRFIKEEILPKGFSLFDNGITGSCIIFSDKSHQEFIVYDFELNLIAKTQFDTRISCFTVSPNNKTIYYVHSMSDGNDSYTVLYENTTDMTEEKELFRKNDLPVAPFELMGFTGLYPLENDRLIYSGYSYSSVQIGTQSIPCSGQFNTENCEYTCDFPDFEKQFVTFNGGVMSYDKPLPYGMKHSGEVDLYTEEKEIRIQLSNLDESQAVCISHNGKYICSVLSKYDDNFDLEYTDINVYSTNTREKLITERFDYLYVDIKAIDEETSSLLIETYGTTNETPLVVKNLYFG